MSMLSMANGISASASSLRQHRRAGSESAYRIPEVRPFASRFLLRIAGDEAHQIGSLGILVGKNNHRHRRARSLASSLEGFLVARRLQRSSLVSERTVGMLREHRRVLVDEGESTAQQSAWLSGGSFQAPPVLDSESAGGTVRKLRSTLLENDKSPDPDLRQ